MSKKNLKFIGMLILSLPDLPWAIFNLIQAGLIYGIGRLTKSRTLALYGRNIALSVDQFFGTKAMGQDPDVSISMALGIARKKHMEGTARVSKFWLVFGEFVNWLFSFQKDHVVESIEHEESQADRVVKIHESIEPEELK